MFTIICAFPKRQFSTSREGKSSRDAGNAIIIIEIEDRLVGCRSTGKRVVARTVR